MVVNADHELIEADMKGHQPPLPLWQPSLLSHGDPLSLAVFDGGGFARALRDGRRQLDLSTRELAQLAGISQAYVVALERALRPHAGNSPTPTVEVVARLAWALGCEPTALFSASLRYPARHVLHIIEVPIKRSALDHAREAATTPVDMWVDSIRLHRERYDAYHPERVVAALHRELHSLSETQAGGFTGQRLGLVFDEMSEVMGTVSDPDAVIAFEANWAQTVEAAAGMIGARVAWNVCVYELAALQGLSNPAEAAKSLLDRHDTVWFSHARGRATGEAAACRLLRMVA
jgi:transcriptional regulator with XRE-family HTH domain